MSAKHTCCVYLGDELARYAFGDDHPFGPLRHGAFSKALYKKGLDRKVDTLHPVSATQDMLELCPGWAQVTSTREIRLPLSACTKPCCLSRALCAMPLTA